MSTLTNALWIMRFSSLANGTSTIPAPCKCQILFPLILWGYFSLVLYLFFTCMHWSVVGYILVGNSGQISGVLFLWNSCLSGTLPYKLKLSWSPWILSSACSAHGDGQALPQFNLPALWPGYSHKAIIRTVVGLT